jgi:hypothetical protein
MRILFSRMVDIPTDYLLFARQFFSSVKLHDINYATGEKSAELKDRHKQLKDCFLGLYSSNERRLLQKIDTSLGVDTVWTTALLRVPSFFSIFLKNDSLEKFETFRTDRS